MAIEERPVKDERVLIEQENNIFLSMNPDAGAQGRK
jgi:hypothetical protein